ncbi:hypothetical protein AURDEDRAFT_166498 [Auricularia subglabra TFB-10046 SS5]|nr:hypothetical protein AURDEDRAFT_166498 [Auricularia subglabra TFB-10046 SS5]
MNVRPAFPSVCDLSITCRANFAEDTSPLIDFRGLNLRRLDAEIDTNDPGINELLLSEIDEQLAVSSPAVPVVRRYCTWGMWGQSAWDRVSETLNMRVHGTHDRTEADVIMMDSRLCRVHWFDYRDQAEWDMGEPLDELSFLADRLAYVRIQNHYLPGFLQFRCRMPVLRCLQLDLDGPVECNMVWPPYHNDVCYTDFCLDDVDQLSMTFDAGSERLHHLPCPVLDELVITSSRRGWAVESREAAHLGQALEQAVRLREKRARLVLRGVTWTGPVLDELLSLIFSTVVVSPFTKDDPDGSLWDPCLD